jgi:hypothetical protein
VRKAFYGGRTEAFTLYCNDAPISYEDVTSLYPWVNFTKKYPAGHPKVITHDFKPLEEYFGLIDCTILPPTNLFIPVLPMHAGKDRKLLFPLCQTCAENFLSERCDKLLHKETDRALVGTWFIEEVKLAVSKGYVLKKIYSVWHFDQTTENLFTDYVKTFYKKKLLSSKLPFECEEEIVKYIQEVKERENISIDNITEFKANPGLRHLTKLMLNNLWGRFGMQDNMSKCVFLSDFDKLLGMLNDDSVEVQGLRVVSDTMVQVIHKAKTVDFLEMSKDTNIYIAIATTAYARIRLYQELDQLKERALYCDTDSVVYRRSPDNTKNLRIGNFLGDMTDELDQNDHIVEFVTGGPKNYAYRTHDGKVVVKVKGFTLNSVNAPAFSFENVKKIILEGLVTSDEVAGTDNEVKRKIGTPAKFRKLENDVNRCVFFVEHLTDADVASALFTTKGISVFNPTRICRARDWKMLSKPEQKLYSFYFDKRIVLSNFQSLPYGYVGRIA